MTSSSSGRRCTELSVRRTWSLKSSMLLHRGAEDFVAGETERPRASLAINHAKPMPVMTAGIGLRLALASSVPAKSPASLPWT